MNKEQYLELVEHVKKSHNIAFAEASEAFDSLHLEDECRSRLVDNGIGSYEFWGHKSVDKRMEFEVEGEGKSILDYWTDEENDIDEFNGVNAYVFLQTSKDDYEEYEITLNATVKDVKKTKKVIDFKGKSYNIYHVVAEVEWNAETI